MHKAYIVFQFLLGGFLELIVKLCRKSFEFPSEIIVLLQQLNLAIISIHLVGADGLIPPEVALADGEPGGAIIALIWHLLSKNGEV